MSSGFSVSVFVFDVCFDDRFGVGIKPSSGNSDATRHAAIVLKLRIFCLADPISSLVSGKNMALYTAEPRLLQACCGRVIKAAKEEGSPMNCSMCRSVFEEIVIPT